MMSGYADRNPGRGFRKTHWPTLHATGKRGLGGSEKARLLPEYTAPID
jgi:hypothetical protein